MAFDKVKRRQKIRYRIRNKVKGTAKRPRLSVFRSNSMIYCQVIDDVNSRTLVSASSKDNGIAGSGTKVEQAKNVGKLIAERALAENITEFVFDRGGFLYHGRVKALAEGAREGGIKF